MPTEPQPLTVAELVRRAVEVVDPDGVHESASQLLARFEDDDEPVIGALAFEDRLDSAREAVDPQDADPAAAMAVAVIRYLSFRRDEIEGRREDVLRLAARAEFDGDPPAQVADWLSDEGVVL